eukprot:gene30380-37967_t
MPFPIANPTVAAPAPAPAPEAAGGTPAAAKKAASFEERFEQYQQHGRKKGAEAGATTATRPAPKLPATARGGAASAEAKRLVAEALEAGSMEKFNEIMVGRNHLGNDPVISQQLSALYSTLHSQKLVHLVPKPAASTSLATAAAAASTPTIAASQCSSASATRPVIPPEPSLAQSPTAWGKPSSARLTPGLSTGSPTTPQAPASFASGDPVKVEEDLEVEEAEEEVQEGELLK